MPKIKTNRSAAKRFKTTGSGKVKRNKSNMRHILTKKSSKRKRQLGKSTTAAQCNVGSIKQLCPYIF
ncbi:MAG TPA: 50S ribosomal protein L35 [Desulfomicrobiaceae bacterium]|nr:50S ribosomal protein L35 [Desulfomicrobiaceae bacterium]